MSSLEAFGPNLRRMRLHRGISLEELSSRTKVSVDLWDALETNDFSRWPSGLAARAYIRDYAEAVGADADEVIDEFCRLVPQADRRAERLVRGTAELIGHRLIWNEDLPPALTAGDRRAPIARQEGGVGVWSIEAHPRGMAAGVDLVVVAVLAAMIAAAFRPDFWATLATVALLYHGVSLAFLGCSPAVWAIDTYSSTHGPLRLRGHGPIFRRLARMQDDERAPDRNTAS